MGKLFLHATNIHQGGGRSLLNTLLQALPGNIKSVLSLDERMAIPAGVAHNVQVKRVKPSLVQRFIAEKWLAQSVASEDIVLCFGNLPPLFRLRGRTVVFVQNRYLIDDVKLNRFPLGVRMRLVTERLWLSKSMKNVDEFVVQTPTMKRLLEQKTGGNIPVRILPFMAELRGYSRKMSQPVLLENGEFDFVYVASGEPHKNHRILLEAWCLLADEGVFPSLCLTLDEDRFATLCKEIEVMRQQHSLIVTNAGELSHQDALALYTKAGAAIYPSTFESFGLPLIEAHQAGLPVLASELDYVRDVLDPEQTFDPESSQSIARSVKRYLGKEEQALPLLDAHGFIERILNPGDRLC
jgi:glycosyltransferase involved in cell wall biosynthesis